MKALIINKAMIESNIEIIKQKADTEIIGVLKSDGYGMGLLQLAQILSDNSINRFAVTEPSDALLLRENGFTEQEILVMRSTSIPSEIETIIEASATATIGSYDAAVTLNGILSKTGSVLDVHVKLDTGMGRYGFFEDEYTKIKNVYTSFEFINVTGIYTHFHSAFSSEKETVKQLRALNIIVSKLQEEGIDTGLVHAANSSALFKYPQCTLDAVRIGSAFTGRIPAKSHTGLKRVGYIKSEVIETKWLPKGFSVGYGATYITKHPTEVAIIPVGYTDGFCVEKTKDIYRFRDYIRYMVNDTRNFLKRKKIYVTVNGKKVPVLGHVGLCHTTVDITNLKIKVGDEAIFDVSPLFVNPTLEKIYE